MRGSEGGLAGDIIKYFLIAPLNTIHGAMRNIILWAKISGCIVLSSPECVEVIKIKFHEI